MYSASDRPHRTPILSFLGRAECDLVRVWKPGMMNTTANLSNGHQLGGTEPCSSCAGYLAAVLEHCRAEHSRPFLSHTETQVGETICLVSLCLPTTGVLMLSCPQTISITSTATSLS